MSVCVAMSYNIITESTLVGYWNGIVFHHQIYAECHIQYTPINVDIETIYPILAFIYDVINTFRRNTPRCVFFFSRFHLHLASNTVLDHPEHLFGCDRKKKINENAWSCTTLDAITHTQTERKCSIHFNLNKLR